MRHEDTRRTMKRIFSIIFALIVGFISLQAQTEHFEFMGIPIDGPIKKFNSKLKSKGFKLSSKEANQYNYKGTFASYDATLFVLFSPQSKNVNEIEVIIFSEKLDDTMETYSSLLNGLTEKYKHSKQIENEFKNEEHSESNSFMFYNNSIGGVLIRTGILCSRKITYFVRLTYFDTANNKIAETEKNTDL